LDQLLRDTETALQQYEGSVAATMDQLDQDVAALEDKHQVLQAQAADTARAQDIAAALSHA
jgi:hypothetical protein